MGDEAKTQPQFQIRDWIPLPQFMIDITERFLNDDTDVGIQQKLWNAVAGFFKEEISGVKSAFDQHGVVGGVYSLARNIIPLPGLALNLIDGLLLNGETHTGAKPPSLGEQTETYQQLADHVSENAATLSPSVLYVGNNKWAVAPKSNGLEGGRRLVFNTREDYQQHIINRVTGKLLNATKHHYAEECQLAAEYLNDSFANVKPVDRWGVDNDGNPRHMDFYLLWDTLGIVESTNKNAGANNKGCIGVWQVNSEDGSFANLFDDWETRKTQLNDPKVCAETGAVIFADNLSKIYNWEGITPETALTYAIYAYNAGLPKAKKAFDSDGKINFESREYADSVWLIYDMMCAAKEANGGKYFARENALSQDKLVQIGNLPSPHFENAQEPEVSQNHR